MQDIPGASVDDRASKSVLLNTFVVKKKRCRVYLHRGTLIWETERPPYSKRDLLSLTRRKIFTEKSCWEFIDEGFALIAFQEWGIAKVIARKELDQGCILINMDSYGSYFPMAKFLLEQIFLEDK